MELRQSGESILKEHWCDFCSKMHVDIIGGCDGWNNFLNKIVNEKNSEELKIDNIQQLIHGGYSNEYVNTNRI